MHRRSKHFPRNANSGCFITWFLLCFIYMIFINLKRDGTHSKIPTDENINVKGSLDWRLINEVFEELIRYLVKGKNIQLRPKKASNLTVKNTLKKMGNGQEQLIKIKKNEELMEPLWTTYYGRKDVVVVEGKLVYMIRIECLITVWMAVVHEDQTSVMIQRIFVQVHIDCMITALTSKVHGDRFRMVTRMLVYVRLIHAECLMTAWRTKKQIKGIHSVDQILHLIKIRAETNISTHMTNVNEIPWTEKLSITMRSKIQTTTLKTIEDTNVNAQRRKIRVECLVTVLMAKVHKEHISVVIQRMLIQIHIDCMVTAWTSKVHGDRFGMVKGMFVYMHAEFFMTAWRTKKQIEKIHSVDQTHTVIQTTTLKPTEETSGNVKRKNNKEKYGESVNGECHVGKEEYGEFGKLDQKKTPRGSSKKPERVPKRHKITKCYDMLRLVLVEICSLFFGKRILRRRVLMFICFICLVKSSNGTCSASISTMKKVKNCPESKEEWNKRACQMNCLKVPQNCTSPENFRYHCLQTEKRLKYVELCSPTKLISCHCAMFDTAAEIVQSDDDKRFRGILENCTYLSNAFNVLKAKGCFGIFGAFNSTENSTNIPSEYFKCHENVEHNKTNTYMTSTEGNDNVAIAAAIIVPVVAVAIVTGIIVKILKARRQHVALQPDVDGPVEMHDLIRQEEH